MTNKKKNKKKTLKQNTMCISIKNLVKESLWKALLLLQLTLNKKEKSR